jgi:hypothetical protein
MTTPNVEVDLDQLRTHAATVGDLSSSLSAVAGGLTGGPGDHALGTFVQFLTAALGEAATRATDVVSGASSAIGAVSNGLAQTAAGYQNTDDQNAGNLRWEEVQ